MKKLREAAQAVMSAESLGEMATALDSLRDALAEEPPLSAQELHAAGWRRCAEGQGETQHCALLEAAVLAEREACAKAVERYAGAWDDEGYAIAQAIRARGEEDKFEIKEDRIHRDAGGTRAATAIRARGNT
jgi:hypothetical protein